MSKFSIPRMDGYKTLLASWGLLVTGIAGTLLVLADLLTVLGQCLTGDTLLMECIQKLPALFETFVVALVGLLGLGIGHKIEKSKIAKAR